MKPITTLLLILALGCGEKKPSYEEQLFDIANTQFKINYDKVDSCLNAKIYNADTLSYYVGKRNAFNEMYIIIRNSIK